MTDTDTPKAIQFLHNILANTASPPTVLFLTHIRSNFNYDQGDLLELSEGKHRFTIYMPGTSGIWVECLEYGENKNLTRYTGEIKDADAAESLLMLLEDTVKAPIYPEWWDKAKKLRKN